MTEQHERFSGEEDEPLSDGGSEKSGRRRLEGWLTLLGLMAVVLLVVQVGGDALYDPPSRLPQSPNFTSDQYLLGTTRSIVAELRLIEQMFPANQMLELELTGEIYKVSFRRSLADRIFGEHREDAFVFAATTAGNEYRFLVLRDGKSQIYAVEAARLRVGDAGPVGLFIGVPAEPPFQQLTAALAALLDALEGSDIVDYSFEDFTVFGPFKRGDRGAIQRKIIDNVVLSHLVESLEGGRADISVAAMVFLISPAAEGRNIRALYQPYFGVVMEPAWGSSETSTLAHELVHAYLDKVERQRIEKLSAAADHFEEAHPRLYGEVISDLYRDLDRLGRAEEAVANIVGALAAGETRTVQVAVALRNEDLARTAEPILISDVALLAEFGLIPKCMDPNELGYQELTITFAYYDMVRDECS